MPVTRSANAAIDKVAAQHAEVAALLADYGASDLLCYRAEEPEALVARQVAAWDPPLDWAATHLGARLRTGAGIVPVVQESGVLARLADRVRAMDSFVLTGFHDLVSLSGSLILAFAATEGWDEPDRIWILSRIDEDWQIAQWGADAEAAEAAEIKRQAFLHAYRFVRLAGLQPVREQG